VGVRKSRILVLLVALLALAAPVVPTTSAASDPGRTTPPPPPTNNYREYVALGDSWTADVVILNTDGLPDSTYAPVGCAQSHRNYPKLVAKAIGAKKFRDASCGSATTDDFTHPQTGLPTGGANSPQFGRLTKTTDLVTVGIGGNDAGIAAAGIDCLNVLPVEVPVTLIELFPEIPIPFIGGHLPPLGGCKHRYTKGGVDRLTRNIRKAEPKVVRALRQIHRISPDARILLVDYMRVIPDHGCYPLVPATDKDMRYISGKFDQLNAMLERAAHRGGAELVSTAKRTRGHHLCTSFNERYAETLGLSVNDLAIGVPAHPNAAGARAQAASVLDYLRAHPK
jgi:hypothetical protein